MAVRRQVRIRPVRSRPLIVFLVLASLTLLVADQSGDASPVHWVRSTVRDTFSAAGNGVDRLWPFDQSVTVNGLQDENDALRSQLETAKGQLAQVDDARQERDQLKALLALPTADDSPKVVAEVINVGASNFDSTMQLNKGSNDGIQTNMPVVTGIGLVGRVVQTSETRSTVLLLTDTTSNVAIRYAKAGDVGVAAGQGIGELLRGDLIHLDSAVVEGEIAVTSGTDGSLFPAGVPVAKVTSSNAGPRDLRRSIQLEPLVDFDKLRSVAVIKWAR